jgi:aminoglycoside phosphotransferase (APT) family kinase protein
MTMLTNLWKWIESKFAGKLRLIIEYLMIAALATVAGFAFNSWMKERDLEGQVGTLSTKVGGLSQSLDQAVQANRDQDDAIKALKDLRKNDSDSILGLRKLVETNATKNRQVSDKITQLEQNNAQAKALLDVAVPTAVGCVLDGTCPANSGSTNKN